MHGHESYPTPLVHEKLFNNNDVRINLDVLHYFIEYLLPHASTNDSAVSTIIFTIIIPKEPSKLSFLRLLEGYAFSLKKIFGRVFHFQDQSQRALFKLPFNKQMAYQLTRYCDFWAPIIWFNFLALN